ncbi:MAG: hypothetical protein E8F57_05030 [Methylophaga nitratireducenticrescens]|uniref:hypothetical protein n=1 Tax=Methylophaga sp. SB9B TaxID=2570356 RepID=UPI0010A7EB4A|nr:hypothetical protein [Methylophaga sp. SB9B]THF57296.1 MAG: hypothetical protein E8F57_05030 [Methylophaga nitratireducenticrescens]THK40545.1 hypothetical protein E8Q33_12955 [Methylophaga sp. SB9B]
MKNIFHTLQSSFITMTLGLMLIACSGESDSNTSVPDTSPAEVVEQPAPMPKIYIDQNIVPTSAENRRGLYRDLLELCREEGIPTKALLESEALKIGTIRLQRWLDEGRTAYRLEFWDYQMAEPQKKPRCEFQLVSSGRHVLIEPEGLRGIDLNDNQPFKVSPLTGADATLLLRSPARTETTPADRLQTVAGQPCVEKPIPGNKGAIACTWAGGMQWGFEPRSFKIVSVLDAQHYELFRSIILQQQPGGDVPDKVTTVAFRINKAFDESAMQPAPATASPARRP